MKRITIIIADDHTLLREAWSFILNKDPRFQVVAGCGSAEQAIEQASQLRPDIVMMDINLPGMNGIEATAMILKYAPCTRVLAVSQHTQPVYARKIMQKGAMGYVTKNSSRDEMVKAILEIHSGKKYICDQIKTGLVEQMICGGARKNEFNALSLREMEVIGFIKQGNSSKEIARSLFLSVKTIEVHRYNILKKLKLKNSSALVNFIHTMQLDFNECLKRRSLRANMQL
jgi:DNA-binding NarL/FixJ family response regulator